MRFLASARRTTRPEAAHVSAQRVKPLRRIAPGLSIRRRRTFVATLPALRAALALLLALALPGSSSNPSPSRTPASRFTSNANLVVVDVTVKDPKTGQPIENLKATDFTLLEDNKPQKISQFEFQKLAVEPEPPEPPPTLEDQRALPEDPKTTISLPSHNQIQYHDKRLIVLFFDFSNMGIPEQLRAQDAALKYINTQMTESDLMAILIYTTACR